MPSRKKRLNKRHNNSPKPSTKSSSKSILNLDEFFTKNELTSPKKILAYLIQQLPFISPLIIVLFVVYGNSLMGELVSDDIPLFAEMNKDSWGFVVRSPSLFMLLRHLTLPFIQNSTFAWHLVSLTFHITTSILLFILISQAIKPRYARFATLIFALHPINTEVVSWISAQNYLEFGLIYLFCAILLNLYKSTKNYLYYGIFIVVITIISLIQNYPWTVYVPFFAINFYIFFIERDYKLKNIIIRNLKFIPNYISSGIFILLFSTKGAVSRIEQFTPDGSVNIQNYLNGMIYTTYKNITMLFAPIGLSLYHGEGSITIPKLIIMYVFTAFIAVLLFVSWKKDKVTFATLLMLFLLTSVLYTPFRIAWFFAERYLYMFSSIFALWFVYFVWRSLSWLDLSKYLPHVVYTILVLFSIRVILRNNDWRTRRSLWESTVRVYPASARAYNNLGDVYGKAGDIQAAEQAFLNAIKFRPTFHEAIHNLGLLYMENGYYDYAIEMFERSLEINPQLYQAYEKLSFIYEKQGDSEKAMEYANKAREINPESKSPIYSGAGDGI